MFYMILFLNVDVTILTTTLWSKLYTKLTVLEQQQQQLYKVKPI